MNVTAMTPKSLTIICKRKSENITEYLQRIYDVGGELLSQLNGPHIDFENRPSLSEANNFLIHICQQIKPVENHDSSTQITVDENKRMV